MWLALVAGMRTHSLAPLVGTVLSSGCVAETGSEDDFGSGSKEDAASATDDGKADRGFDICENRGCLPGDHLDEVGQVGDLKADQNTGFDHLRFYRNLAFELGEMGY